MAYYIIHFKHWKWQLITITHWEADTVFSLYRISLRHNPRVDYMYLAIVRITDFVRHVITMKEIDERQRQWVKKKMILNKNKIRNDVGLSLKFGG